jgi:hypothetical protein
MKLHLIFLLLDGILLLTYPVIYITNKLRRLLRLKRS